MAEPETDRGDVDETQKTFCSLVVAGCNATSVLELVEAALDEVPQSIQGVIDANAHLAGLAHGDHRHHVSRFHGFSYVVRVIAAISQQNAWFRQVVLHDQVESEIVRCLAWRDLGSHWQACCIDPEVDLGRKATS